MLLYSTSLQTITFLYDTMHGRTYIHYHILVRSLQNEALSTAQNRRGCWIFTRAWIVITWWYSDDTNAIMSHDVTIFMRAFQSNREQHYLLYGFPFSIPAGVSISPHALWVTGQILHSLRQGDEMSAWCKLTGMIKRQKTHPQTDRQLLVERSVCLTFLIPEVSPWPTFLPVARYPAARNAPWSTLLFKGNKYLHEVHLEL